MGQNKGSMRVSRAINVRSKKENATMPSIATIGLAIRSFLSPRTVRRMINSFGTNLSQNPGFEGQCNLSEYLDTSHQGQSRICDNRGDVLSCGFVANTWRLSFVDKLIVGTSSVSSPGLTFRRGLSVRASIY